MIHRGIFPLLTLATLALLCASANAANWSDSKAVAALFEKYQVNGTFVLYDPNSGELTGFNRERAEHRYVPASTFKIPNTLIGLATGAVEDVDQVLPYGGKPQPFPQWEHDMPLREAISLSAVPIYQELARRIGLQAMAANVKKLGYGNQKIGQVVDQFWLRGPLKISAVEQARFLARLARRELPYPSAMQNRVAEVTLIDERKGEALHGKTGWLMNGDPDIGWWVGWVQRDGALLTFALNIDMLGGEDGDKRIPLGREALAELGVYPFEPQ